MNCTKCNTENLDSAKFCKKCGQDLSKKETKQAKRKHSVKISGGKIKFAIIAIVIIGLIGAGAMSLKKKSDEKRILSMEYLEDLNERTGEDCKIYADVSSYNSNMKEGEIDEGLDSCLRITKELNEASEIFIAYARESKFNDNVEVEEFIKKYILLPVSSDANKEDLDEMNAAIKDIKLFMRNNNNKLDKLGLNEKQSEKFVAIMDGMNSSFKLLDDIKIEKKTEQIEAVYTEQENDKIPAGYSIITAEPQNGEKENVTIIVDGEEKGTGKMITKEPQNGVKMVGSGNTEDIAKQGEEKLNQILKLWREQNFTAATILPFLPEGNENKAPEWESAYKKVIFNWRRFDKVEPILSLASFKENTVWNKKDETYPFVIYLPVTVSHYSNDNAPSIPFYYNAKKDEWVSGNGTIAELFEIIKYQSIEAEISPKSFSFAKTGDCKKDEEVEVKSAVISGVDNLKTDFSVLYPRSVKFTLAVDGLDSNAKAGYNLSLPLTLIDSANKNKSTVLTGKDFEYSSFFDGDCLCSSDVSFTFFK